MLKKMKERAKVLNEILLEKGAEYRIKCYSNWKNNSELCGYSLIGKSGNASPIIYYEDEWYSKSDNEVIEHLDKIYDKCNLAAKIPDLTFEFMEENIMPKIIGSDNIFSMDKHDICHWEVPGTDLTVCFYIPLELLSRNDGVACIQVTEKILKDVGMDKEAAYTYAMRNLETEITIRSMSEIIHEILGMREETSDNMENLMYVISNKKNHNGAAAILSNTAMDRACIIMGCGELIILPSSVHECILIPFNDNADEFVDMVKEVNSSCVNDVDRLTNNAYIYKDNQIIPVV